MRTAFWMPSFRFGLFAENIRSREELLDAARGTEDEGFSTFLIRDHFIPEPFGHQLAPLTALATVAGVTWRLRIGSLVLCNDYRHPVMLAKEAATLDLLSEGRLEIGLGAGFSRSEYERTGITFEPAATRIERLGEAVRIIKDLLTGITGAAGSLILGTRISPLWILVTAGTIGGLGLI
jgi:alkanesulfonate monooxygenase SsuD/methylene tetrahydromethanopterin reductase-like flavin-dependent oxidoreductase (luciferase family)